MKKLLSSITAFISVAIFHSAAFSQTLPPNSFPPNYSSFPSQTALGGNPFPVTGVGVAPSDYVPAYRQVPMPGAPYQISLIGMMPLVAFASQNQISQLQHQFQQENVENRHGIATAMVMTNASMPSAPGRTTWAINATEYRGEQALGGALSHRFDTTVPFAVDVRFAVSGATRIVAAGFQGEF